MTADDDLVFIKTWPLSGSEGRSIYQMPLTVNGFTPATADKIVQESDGISNVGFIYNYKTRSVLWSDGTEIKSLSIDDNSITILADVCKYHVFKCIKPSLHSKRVRESSS